MLEGLEPPTNKSVYCKVDQMKDTLSAEDYAIFIAAVDDKDKWPAKTLTNALRQRGVSVADTTITKHRQRACACHRG